MVLPGSRTVNLENPITIRYWVVSVRYYRDGVWGAWLLVVMGTTFKEKCKHENHDLTARTALLKASDQNSLAFLTFSL